MEGAVRRWKLLRWQELAPLCSDVVGVARRRQVSLQRGSVVRVTSMRRLRRCVGFPWSSYSHFYLLEAKCQSVSVLQELAERKSLRCQMLKSPKAAKSLLQPPPSAKQSLLRPAALLSRGWFVPEIRIPNSACWAPANVLRNDLEIKNVPWKY